MLQGHGDNGYLYKAKIVADFSSNVYFKGVSQQLINHLQGIVKQINNYPEVLGESINELLALHHGLSNKYALVTNGATEAFYMLAQLFKQSCSGIFIPSFSEYIDACSLHQHNIKYLPNHLLNSNFTPKTELVWLANPNNPDGKIIDPKILLKIIKENPASIFIIDEAYTDFSLKNISISDQVSKFKNLIVIRSLTKKHAIPGLRLGYILAHETMIEKILEVKAPWTVNTLALEACKYILQNENENFNHKELLDLSRELQYELTLIDGVKVILSPTSFFLIETDKESKKTKNYLIEKHGLLVRDASNFKGLNEYHIRISTQSKKNNQHLINAMKQWMQS